MNYVIRSSCLLLLGLAGACVCRAQSSTSFINSIYAISTSPWSQSHANALYTIDVGQASGYPICGTITNTGPGTDLTSSTTNTDGEAILTVSGSVSGITTYLESTITPTYEFSVTVTPPPGTTATGTLNVTVYYEWEQYEAYNYTIQASLFQGGSCDLYTADSPTASQSLDGYDTSIITPLAIIGGHFVPTHVGNQTGGGATSGWSAISSNQTIMVACNPNGDGTAWVGTSSTFRIPSPAASIPCYAGATSPGPPTSLSVSNGVSAVVTDATY